MSILKLGDCLIASLQDSLGDQGWESLREDLLRSIGAHRAAGLIIDASAMDVMDSFATRSLDGIGAMAALRGAQTVVVGIQPGVAFAMAQLGLRLDSAATALDLDAGLEALAERIGRRRDVG